MARVAFNEIQGMTNKGNNQNNVGFFSLKSDGDEALVRFMHSDDTSFDVVQSHTILLGGKYRKVSCLRTPSDPKDKCPLCESGVKLENKIYVHLIQYTRDDSGNVISEAKIWERPISFGDYLSGCITECCRVGENEFIPLSDILFKVKRHGKTGDINTKYDVFPVNMQVYKNELYPITNDFEGYDVIGTLVLDKSYDDIKTFMNTGKFPDTNVGREPQNNGQNSSNDDLPFTGPTDNWEPPKYNTNSESRMPWENPSSARRNY